MPLLSAETHGSVQSHGVATLLQHRGALPRRKPLARCDASSGLEEPQFPRSPNPGGEDSNGCRARVMPGSTNRRGSNPPPAKPPPALVSQFPGLGFAIRSGCTGSTNILPCNLARLSWQSPAFAGLPLVSTFSPIGLSHVTPDFPRSRVLMSKKPTGQAAKGPGPRWRQPPKTQGRLTFSPAIRHKRGPSPGSLPPFVSVQTLSTRSRLPGLPSFSKPFSCIHCCPSSPLCHSHRYLEDAPLIADHHAVPV